MNHAFVNHQDLTARPFMDIRGILHSRRHVLQRDVTTDFHLLYTGGFGLESTPTFESVMIVRKCASA